jgi:hypothetical protein
LINQGKLFKNSTRGILGFLRAYLGWSKETYISKLSKIKISFYHFIGILCVKYPVCIIPKGDSFSKYKYNCPFGFKAQQPQEEYFNTFSGIGN